MPPTGPLLHLLAGPVAAPVAGLVTGHVVRPEPGPARTWVQDELRRPEYQEGLVERFASWVRDLWTTLTESALAATPLSTGAAVLVLVVLVVLVLLVAGRVRREPVSAPGTLPLLTVDGLTPQEHRAAAESALLAGAYDTAVVEGFRALATRSLERALVSERPGLTARELAVGLRPVFPAHAGDLDRSSLLFDLVFYGDQPATESDGRLVLELEEALRGARPGRHDDELGRPAAAVPR